MTLLILVYGIVVGGFLMMAAHSLDHAVRRLGRPARWIWLLAMAGTGILPALVFMAPPAVPTEGAGGVTVPLEALYALGQHSASDIPGYTGLLTYLDGSLRILWVTASALALLTFAAFGLRLERKAARWPSREAGGRNVLVSDGTGPAVLGFFKPRIVLPAWTLEMEEEELELILLHEEEHLRARDPALLAAAIFLVALGPWNPALWWGLQRLRLAVEADCDNRVLARGIGRVRYGALLLGVASDSRRLFPLAPALVEGGRGVLERRLQMMKTGVGKKGIHGGLAGLVAGGLFLVLACETPVPTETERGVAEFSAQAPAEGSREWYLLNGVPEGEEMVGFEVRMQTPTDEGILEMEAGRFTFSTDRSIRLDEGVMVKLRPVAEGDGGPGGSPLVYVDGVPLEGGTAAVAKIDPQTIDRIEVIKGGAAQAVFGEEGANGVIQVYLKKSG